MLYVPKFDSGDDASLTLSQANGTETIWNGSVQSLTGRMCSAKDLSLVFHYVLSTSVGHRLHSVVSVSGGSMASDWACQ